MERDFMGLSSKEPLTMVKEEVNNDGGQDSGLTMGSSVPWSFSNKVSAIPSLMSFKNGQEDTTKKSVADPFMAGFVSNSSAERFDLNKKRLTGELQKTFNHDRQGRIHNSLAAFPVQHDVYSVHRPHDGKMFSVSNQAVSVSMGNSFMKNPFAIAGQISGATAKQQLVGGVPVTAPHSIFPHGGSVAGVTEPWNSMKNPGSHAQLTIFYAGTVNVFDEISPEKLQAIMFLAGNASAMPLNAPHSKPQAQGPSSKLAAGDSVPTNLSANQQNCPAGISSPLSVSSHTGAQSGSGSTNNDEVVAAKSSGVPTTPVSKAEPPRVLNAVGAVSVTAMMPSAVPQARKASLARFLEKRKERVMNAAPYNLSKKSMECCATPESNGANFSSSSLAVGSP